MSETERLIDRQRQRERESDRERERDRKRGQGAIEYVRCILFAGSR